MRNTAEPRVRVDTELRVPMATAQLVHFDVKGPADDVMHERDT